MTGRCDLKELRVFLNVWKLGDKTEALSRIGVLIPENVFNVNDEDVKGILTSTQLTALKRKAKDDQVFAL